MKTATKQAEAAIRTLLRFMGEDPKREGLLETPARVIKSYQELFAGYGQDSNDIFKTFSDGHCDEMVVLTNIEFFSFCEHHLMPFFGVAHVGYIPHKRVVGISKLARLVDIYARRLQIQERLTERITAAIVNNLSDDAACVIEARHMCMCARGVNKQQSKMITSSLLGEFRNPEVRSEFMKLIGK